MKIPESTRSSLTLRLLQRQRERWPNLEQLTIRVRGEFAYIDGATPDSDGQVEPLFRLRYAGSATFWGFAIYTWSGMRYEDLGPSQRSRGRDAGRGPRLCLRPVFARPLRLGHELTPGSTSPWLNALADIIPVPRGPGPT